MNRTTQNFEKRKKKQTDKYIFNKKKYHLKNYISNL